MRKKVASVLAVWATVSTAFAATQQMVWGDLEKQLPQFAVKKTVKGVRTLVNQGQNDYQLLPAQGVKQRQHHSRYQLFYKGLPVWGYQLIVHQNAQGKPSVTGHNIQGVENDVKSLSPQLTTEKALSLVKDKLDGVVKFSNIQKIIFIDKQQHARLAYRLSYYTDSKITDKKAPNFIIDANTGELLKHWSSIKSERIGQGMGGTSLPVPYRSSMFQYGDALPGLPSLGKLDVKVENGRCYTENSNFRIMSMLNLELGYNGFPIPVFMEGPLKLETFSYPCSEESLYLNYADERSGPVKYSFSPINDTNYFSNETVAMYKKHYDINAPFGDDLPIRAYTHLGAMDNAFAIPTIYMEDGSMYSHQQIIIGNGDKYFTALTQSVIAHELSHLYTDNNSQLIYEGQSGGINESFSDMAAIAMMDHLKDQYPWYWDGKDWSLGREISLLGEPFRYMDDPTKDGFSIDNANDYNDSLDVHQTSGVFNKAFYLLATKEGWSVKRAFRIMADANMKYWSPIAYYDFAACGVIQSAMDFQYNYRDVIDAFAEVGVQCPIYK